MITFIEGPLMMDAVAHIHDTLLLRRFVCKQMASVHPKEHLRLIPGCSFAFETLFPGLQESHLT